MLLGDPPLEYTFDLHTMASGRRLGHRIIISDVVMQQRWSDFASADILFLNTHTLFGPSERLSVSRMSNSPKSDLHLTFRRAEELFTRCSSSSSPTCQEFTIVDGKARVSSSFSRKDRGSTSWKNGTSAKTGDEISNPLDTNIEMPPEPSRRSTSRLSGIITDRPPFPPGVKGDNKSLPFLKRGFSLGRTVIDPEGRLLPRTDVRSMSELTELDRIAQSRKKDLFVGGAVEGAFTREEEKARKWLSIARKTLNRFVGREKRALYGSENQQRA